MKYTARAPANIAFIKYWGKKDAALRLPYNASISMNLSAAFTTTTVEFSENFSQDDIELLGRTFSAKERARIAVHLDRIRAKGRLTTHARVVTQNSFPASAGIASSASGFAALTLAASHAAGLTLSERKLTILARLGSGSAARSIPDGFVEWREGKSSEESFAYSLYPKSYWGLRDILAIVSKGAKSVSSTDAHAGAQTSPRFAARMEALPGRIARIKAALAEKDFVALGMTLEEDSRDMHAVAQSQVPPIVYLAAATRALLDAVVSWRAEGISAYATVDAGPNVHIICEAKDEMTLRNKVQSISGVQEILVSAPAVGAHLVADHLF